MALGTAGSLLRVTVVERLFYIARGISCIDIVML
jgi:hypothetical protein